MRQRQLALAADAGIDMLPSNDFSLYDHVLDTAVMVGAIAPRFAALDISHVSIEARRGAGRRSCLPALTHLVRAAHRRRAATRTSSATR